MTAQTGCGCECGHAERDHRSIPPYYCQFQRFLGADPCECLAFIEEDTARLITEYEAQRYEDQQERYR